jgi:hypothetical protein
MPPPAERFSHQGLFLARFHCIPKTTENILFEVVHAEDIRNFITIQCAQDRLPSSSGYGVFIHFIANREITMDNTQITELKKTFVNVAVAASACLWGGGAYVGGKGCLTELDGANNTAARTATATIKAGGTPAPQELKALVKAKEGEDDFIIGSVGMLLGASALAGARRKKRQLGLTV